MAYLDFMAFETMAVTILFVIHLYLMLCALRFLKRGIPLQRRHRVW